MAEHGIFQMGEKRMDKQTASSSAFARQQIDEFCSKHQGEVVRKDISFLNDDVPAFLEQLARFEAESRKSRLMVG